ncbi:MAG: sensor histidine kinase [Candidatus Heimdallarchaeota archaeon]
MPSSTEELIDFDSLTQMTQMIFSPSGYSVQIKDQNHTIVWEDGVSLEHRKPKVGHKCYRVNFGRSEPCSECLLLQTKLSGLPAVKEDRHLGDGKWYSVLALPILYQGEIMTLELIKEITREKRNAQQLKFASSKDAFFTDILVHDLLNYLSITSLTLEDLEKRRIPDYDNIGQAIQIARKNAIKAMEILSELRNLRVEAETELYPVSIVTTLKETIGELQSLYTSKEIRVNYKLDVDSLEPTVLANKLLSILFLNILKNSVSNTPSNPVQIEIEINQGSDIKEIHEIKISDWGKGISPKMRPILFDPKARKREGWKTAPDSLGLGMTIIKTLVDLFGGEIKYDSRVLEDWSQGTTVTLKLPRVQSFET